MKLSNPSSLPLVIQPLMLYQYSRPLVIIDLLASCFDQNLNLIEFTRSPSVFTLHPPDGESLPSPQTSSSAPTLAVIPPSSDPYHLTVAFTPQAEQPATGLLLIRNNLTVLDYVVLQGQGILGVFTMDGIQPGTEPLLFEFSSPYLERCQGALL